MAVGFGRAQPEGAVPLWPWRSALASIGVSDDGTGAPRAALEGGVTDRFAIFERFADQLRDHASRAPLVLLLDDLQWAELSTLLLFRHLVEHPALGGVLIAGALRTTEPMAGDATEVVSRLLADPKTDVLEVPKFDAAEMAAFAEQASSRRLTEADLALLARRSGGNPFLLGELLRWAPSRGSTAELDAALPLAVRESVRRRIVVEGPATQLVVKATAVVGSAVSLDLLAMITGVDRVELSAALDAALRSGLLVAHADGSVGFVHDLLREAVYSLLPTWDRMQLHHAVGIALRVNARSSSWAAVAAHLEAARPLVDDSTLADAARHAADEAARLGAFDEAAAYIGVALDLSEHLGDVAERGALLLEQGRLLWAAERSEESNAVLAEAAELARRTLDTDLLARVALSLHGGEVRTVMRRADDQLVALLREALAAVPSGDSRLRCLLLGRLALCGYSDIGDRDGISTCDEAVAMAQRLGDPEALTTALGARFYYRWRPGLARERLAIADEILAAVAPTGDAGLIAQAHSFRILALLDLGWLRDAWSELEQFGDAAALSGQPMLRLRALWFLATRHLAQGARSLAEEVSDQAVNLAVRMGRPDASVEQLGQSLLLWPAEDRVDDALRLVSPGMLGPTAYNAVVALINGVGGRPVEAQAALDAVVAGGMERFPHDMMWLTGRCGLLAAATVGGDRDTGRLLYEELSSFAGLWVVVNPGILVVGAVDHYLGLGAALLDRLDDAVEHLRRAASVHEAEGAPALALLSLRELVTVLERRQESGDEAAIETIARRASRHTPRNAVPFKSLLPIMWAASEAAPLTRHAQRFAIEGDTWLVEFGGRRGAVARPARTPPSAHAARPPGCRDPRADTRGQRPRSRGHARRHAPRRASHTRVPATNHGTARRHRRSDRQQRLRARLAGRSRTRRARDPARSRDGSR